MTTDATWNIVVLDAMTPSSFERLLAFSPPGFRLRCATQRGDEHLKEIIAAADFAIAGQVRVSGDVLRAARRLKLLHKWGVGVDNIDLDAARACAIPVARTTGSNAVPVAEFTLGLMICAMRGLAAGHTALQQGNWRGFPVPRDPFMISGKTVGIVGFGAIGQRVARLLSGFGCPILYTQRTRLPSAREQELGAEYVGLERLLSESDIVSLHCPLTPQTAGLMNRQAFESMKPTAVLVNTARGGIVVEADLRWALVNRVIHAAAIDVYETEPLPASSALLGLDNLVTTPHLAALAADNYAPTVGRMFANFERVARGEEVPEHDRVVG